MMGAMKGIGWIWLFCAFLCPLTLAFQGLFPLVSRGRWSSTTGLQVYHEDLHAAVQRKEYEMKKFNKQHESGMDPYRVAISYASDDVGTLRLAKALRRVYDDPDNPANPESENAKKPKTYRDQLLGDFNMADASLRRPAICVDIKRKSLSRPGKTFCRFDDAALVAEAMVNLGVDVVFINVDYAAYGGDISELRAAVKAVRNASKRAAVVMKDIVIDEIQLGIAKDSGADGVLLIASVLGPVLGDFLDLATTIGLETIVECHTPNEVQRALELCAQTILVSNYDRVNQKYYPQQALQLSSMFPGSSSPIITLAGGGIETTDAMNRHLAAGYDAVVVGKGCMGNKMAPQFIKAARERLLLPAEMAHWGDEDTGFDEYGNIKEDTRDNDDDELL
eukprot:Nitzschia sp. Nitz4//scaffold2_size372955//48874//50049//NITZ4_000369-RA/size372955-processed-gene-0.80-mRNA-1//-1//CDS//3329546614//613//frame0